MRYSPPNRQLSDTVKRLTREVSPLPAVLFLGFDYEPFATVSGDLFSGRAAAIAMSLREILCWRALMYVYPGNGGRIRAVLLDVSGDAVYTLNVIRDTESARWVKPDPYMSLLARELMKW